MGLLDADTIEDLMRSSSMSKGIEKTMERVINELELDSMYIVRYDEDLMQPEVMFDWESDEQKHNVSFGDYFQTWMSALILTIVTCSWQELPPCCRMMRRSYIRLQDMKQ